MQEHNFHITDDEKVICKEDARVTVKEILFTYLKMKAPTILFTLIMAYLAYQAIVKINDVSIRLWILSFVTFFIFIFWFLNKKPKQFPN